MFSCVRSFSPSIRLFVPVKYVEVIGISVSKRRNSVSISRRKYHSSNILLNANDKPSSNNIDERVTDRSAAYFSACPQQRENFDRATDGKLSYKTTAERLSSETTNNNSSNDEPSKGEDRQMLEVNTTGDVVTSEFRRSDLGHRFSLHPRDIRFLDSSLRNLPSILSRAKVIIVNLELFKAIISADSVCLFDPSYSHIQEIVSLLTNSLKTVDSSMESEQKLPFELVVLEIVLMTVCRNLESTFEQYRKSLSPLLDNSITNVNEGLMMMHLRELKNDLSSFEIELREIGNAIRDVLENDDDMCEMYLTEKKLVHTRTIDQHTEVEVLLETYLRKVDELENEVKTDLKLISVSEEHIQIRLDTVRNAIMKLELLLSIGTLSVTTGAFGAGIFGMNLSNHLEKTPYGMYLIGGAFIVLVGICIRQGIRLCARHNIDLFQVYSVKESNLKQLNSNKKQRLSPLSHINHQVTEKNDSHLDSKRRNEGK
ncbi:unnamed protein product [Didymodactylos carnosus]|uniref:Magnesium transporter n=1 Tax=Didymodactylos carnosus TaxID=1234261 RepID=A0A8S2DAN5_9BILA|nr:unnamed protein product [Didymodactylos carnosus]CAF3635277.1 unnamed protein product [Didymodactylos carnosus]